MDRHYDLIVIGTGAGGGTIVYELVPTGKILSLSTCSITS